MYVRFIVPFLKITHNFISGETVSQKISSSVNLANRVSFLTQMKKGNYKCEEVIT